MKKDSLVRRHAIRNLSGKIKTKACVITSPLTDEKCWRVFSETGTGTHLSVERKSPKFYRAITISRRRFPPKISTDRRQRARRQSTLEEKFRTTARTARIRPADTIPSKGVSGTKWLLDPSFSSHLRTDCVLLLFTLITRFGPSQLPFPF